MSKTTFDLSTLSDIADGTHTVKVKAKASGYNDSEFSNEVSYTKVPAGYSGTITNTKWSTQPCKVYKTTESSSYFADIGVDQSLQVVGNFFMVAVDSVNEGASIFTHSNCTFENLTTSVYVTPTANNWEISINFQ